MPNQLGLSALADQTNENTEQEFKRKPPKIRNVQWKRVERRQSPTAIKQTINYLLHPKASERSLKREDTTKQFKQIELQSKKELALRRQLHLAAEEPQKLMITTQGDLLLHDAGGRPQSLAPSRRSLVHGSRSRSDMKSDRKSSVMVHGDEATGESNANQGRRAAPDRRSDERGRLERP